MILPAGCARPSGLGVSRAPASPRFYQTPAQFTALQASLIERPDYRLNVGDTLEIIYHVEAVTPEGKDYQLQREDVVTIRFPYDEKYNQDVTIQNDGKIRLLLVGPVRAIGMTLEQLQEQLRGLYSRYIRDPELTCNVQAANIKIVELKKAITTAPRGQSRLVPIKPDGTIDLPYIGEALAFGKTVKELRRELKNRYIEVDLGEIDVTVQTLEFAPRRVFVMGEVWGQGMITIYAPITALQAITSAGGITPRGDQQRVMLIRRYGLPVPEAIVMDVDSMLEATRPSPQGVVPDGSIFRYDPWLADGDILYVPPTELARANDWIDQVFTRGIRSVLPYDASVGMNFGYQIYSPPTTVTTRTNGPPRINAQLGP